MSTTPSSNTNSSAVRIVLDGYARLKRMKSRVTPNIGTENVPNANQWSDDEASSPPANEQRADAADAADATGGISDATDEATTVDLTKLDPSTQIVTAIEREDDWMWQSDVVDAVDLSSSTVSRHLSSLEDEGDVQRVRIGREKVVGLPGADLDVFGSTYENAPAE